MIESGNDARHVVRRETVIVPDILTPGSTSRAGQPGRTCQPVSLRACVIVCPRLVVHQRGMMIRGPNRWNTADGPEQQGRERERDGDDERLGRLEQVCIGKTTRLGTGTAG